MSEGEQLEIPLGEVANLPPPERFPYNHGRHKVEDFIIPDLKASKNPLIVTGYTSLDQLISFLSNCYQDLLRDAEAFAQIRVVLGHEPLLTPKSNFQMKEHQLSQAVIDYWLEQGISLYLCAKVLMVMTLIESKKLKARISSQRPIHAKIYKGDVAVTSGSSNFSRAGLSWQGEINTRFTEKAERERFEEAGQLAEAFWFEGRDYNQELWNLLHQLLRVVSWQEALARACAELLEGDWAKRYLETKYLGDEPALWPSQEKGIAQAIWVIDNVGSVLVADATGSGKTRMGAQLIKAVVNRIWRTGRMRRDIPILTCPPSVQENWERETIACGHHCLIYSHGLLSLQNSSKSEDMIRAIRRAQVLAVDEAHNFLNRYSRRTRALFSNMADYVLLFTATPINRGPYDLLAIIDLLGADNFDDQVLQVIEHIWRRQGDPNETMSRGEREILQREIQRFTVRRTKTTLNRMVEQEQDKYKDQYNRLCRYPKHQAKTYSCNETELDKTLAQSIRDATKQLRGLINIQSCLQLSDAQREDGWDEQAYLDWRLKGARGLAAHCIMANLRSSRVALLEHLYGTNAVQSQFQILGKIKTEETGNVIRRLQDIAGHVPENKLEIRLPTWLVDAAEHARACEEEIALYTTIAELVQQMSQARENAKVQLLLKLIARHNPLLSL